ncbi:hypothetical protein [Paraburkholderia sp. BCC1885]|uniref:hypothetical protein n=1 Tax=Paraburkholderia sp. BCC1885 TaxID=2562669 RepID=UPI001182D69D|nr:hypothetical protein [Paraburkholderia sp. BCC1885]
MTEDQEIALSVAIGLLKKNGYPAMAGDLFELRRTSHAGAKHRVDAVIHAVECECNGYGISRDTAERILVHIDESSGVPAPRVAQSDHSGDGGAGHCSEGDRCVCGGDLPRVREGCANWRAGTQAAPIPKDGDELQVQWTAYRKWKSAFKGPIYFQHFDQWAEEFGFHVWQAALASNKAAAVAYVNGHELRNMLPDDETAGPDRTPGIQRKETLFRDTPLYAGTQATTVPQDGDERTRFVAWHKNKFGWYGDDVDACKDRFTIWQAALAQKAVPVAAEPTDFIARAIALEERACRTEDVLIDLVNQIRKSSPVDDHGHDFKMNMAFVKAVELLDAAQTDAAIGAPQAIQRIMARLAGILDEDQFAEIEQIATSAGIKPPAPIASAEENVPVGWTTQFDLANVARGETGVIFKQQESGDIPLYTHPAAAQPSRAEVLERADLSDDELALIREEAATITDDWSERQLIEPTRKESDAKFVREILRLAGA